MNLSHSEIVVLFELAKISLALFSILFMLIRGPRQFWWAIVCMSSIVLFSLGKIGNQPSLEYFRHPLITTPVWRLILPPALYLFLRTILGLPKIGPLKILLHFLPFLFFYLAMALLHGPPPSPDAPKAFHPRMLLGMPYFICLLGVYLSYFWLILRMVFRHQKEYLYFFSYADNFNTLNWVKWLVVALFILFISNAIFIINFPPHHHQPPPFAFLFIHLLHLTVVLFLSLFLVNQPILFKQEWRGMLEAEAYKKTKDQLSKQPNTESLTDSTIPETTPAISTLTEEGKQQKKGKKPSFSKEDLELIERLENYMTTEQAFLQIKLKVADLAEDIDTTAHHLSKLINDYYGYNFFYFINYYRIEYAKELLNNPDSKRFTIEGLGMQSGFHSRGTFNTWFKKVTGLSP